MPGLFLIQVLLLVKLSFTFVKSRNFFKGFHDLFFVGERNDSFKRNLTDFLCMILSCVCFFVARKYPWRFLRGCWTGRAKCNFYLLGPIEPYFGFVYSGNFSQQLQKCLVVIYRLHVNVHQLLPWLGQHALLYQLLPHRINAIKIFFCFAGKTMPINDSGKDQENFWNAFVM